MPRSMKLIAAVFVVACLAVGTFLFFSKSSVSNGEVPIATADVVPTLDKPVSERGTPKAGGKVLVRRSVAMMRPDYIRLKGRTFPARSVTVKSEISGPVVAAAVTPGTVVKEGTVLCAIDNNEAAAKLAEARAELEAAERDLKETIDLVAGGWKTPAAQLAASARVEASRSDVSSREQAVARTRLKAPFDGLFENRHAQIGDLLAPGDACGEMLDLDPLLAVVDATEEQALRISTDARVLVRLGGANELTKSDDFSGKVRFVASAMDAVSGKFQVEAAIPNPDMVLRAGQTADVRIEIGQGLAHLINPAGVIRAEDGRHQVRHVGVDRKIKISDVKIIDSQPDGVWVSGLPEVALIVVEGQGDLPDGLPVDVSVEDENS
ncbi:MAG: efflux transporter periplasmic adaptor subunit [Hirschia sp.]|nr:efflux transporter periplasmic adaptor subunit [Hirschia sp.]MBF18418.1 efflux transporter periplasmic adaptor subunit [Hirschia sp.]